MYTNIEKNVPPELVKTGLKRRIHYLENLMTVVIDFEHPMEVPDPPHSHPHEQITYVAEGELSFFIGDEIFMLNKGDMIKIPSGALHTVQTIAPNTRLIDSFSPIREDFIR